MKKFFVSPPPDEIKPFKTPVYITKTLSPDRNEFFKEYTKIQKSGIYSNFGQMHNELEIKLKKYLKVKNLALFNNGTTALLASLRALDIKGEVITSPYTFPATVNVIKFLGLTPVFCEIDEYLNIDADKIEEKITPKTTCILAAHTFGVPVDYKKIKLIADKYNLKVIYDAAHSFGTAINNTPVGVLGDITMFSFHATKIFNTIEGGCLCTNDNDVFKKILLYRNFGKENEDIILDGINGKMNEIQALTGLLVLPKVKKEISKRKILTEIYNKELSDIKQLQPIKQKDDVKLNYQYYIVRLKTPYLRDLLYEKLQNYNIFTRKYFYPCAFKYKYADTNKSFPNSEKASLETLALPMYGDLTKNDIIKICQIIRKIIKESQNNEV